MLKKILTPQGLRLASIWMCAFGIVQLGIAIGLLRIWLIGMCDVWLVPLAATFLLATSIALIVMGRYVWTISHAWWAGLVLSASRILVK
jgi:hypothetical protein